MRVLHIANTYSDKKSFGGATMAASRLHKKLLKRGYESWYVCRNKFGTGVNVVVLPLGRLQKIVYKIVSYVSTRIWKITPIKRSVNPSLVPLYGFERVLAKIKPDVIHVHAMSLSYSQIKAVHCPVLFALHDFTLLNAVMPHPEEDQRYQNGFDAQNSNWVERLLFNRKRNLIQTCDCAFVAPSKWGAMICQQSLIGANNRVDVISNIVGSEFQVKDDVVRRRGKFRVLFGCNGGFFNHYKGGADLVSSLELLPKRVQDNIQLVVFGTAKGLPDDRLSGIEVENLGVINGANALCEVYNSCDLFLFPSKYETQGMTKVEAMLSGLPVVAFDRSSCAERIAHKQSGWIAKNQLEFSLGVSWWFDEWASGRYDLNWRHQIHRDAVENYGMDNILERVLSVYRRTTE